MPETQGSLSAEEIARSHLKSAIEFFWGPTCEKSQNSDKFNTLKSIHPMVQDAEARAAKDCKVEQPGETPRKDLNKNKTDFWI